MEMASDDLPSPLEADALYYLVHCDGFVAKYDKVTVWRICNIRQLPS